MRRARRADANRAALHDGWIRIGGSWLDLVPELGGEPDALVGWRGEDRLIEIKNPTRKASARRARPNQIEWHRSWKGRRPVVVETLADIIRLFP